MAAELDFCVPQLRAGGDNILASKDTQPSEGRARIGDETLVGDFLIAKARGPEHITAGVPCRPLDRRLGWLGLRHELLVTDRARHPSPAGPRVCDRAAVADQVNAA